MKVDPGEFRLGDTHAEAPAVLCIHGLTGTPWEVRHPAEALARHGFACWGPVLPGHGTTPAELAKTPRSAWLEAVLGAWDELSIVHRRVYVMGLSLGGVLSLALSQRRPVAGAVVMAAPLQLSLSVRLGVPLLRHLVRDVPKTPGILDDEARERHPGYDRMPLSAVYELLRLASQVEANLGCITAPLQLIYSRRDETVRLDDAERIRSGVGSAHSRIHYLEDSGHVLPVDRERDRVADEVVDFLRGLERDAVDAPSAPGES